MKYSHTTTGLLALAYGSAITMAAALPRSGSHVVDLDRDETAYKAAIQRQISGGKSKRQDSGDVGLAYGSYWFANVTVASQDVQMLLDTGSADFWLVAPGDDSSVTDGVMTWDPTTATGATAMDGETFSIGYGQGGNGVSGPVYQAPVCIGSACTTMAVGSATTDSGLGNFPRSGILGLAFKGGNSVTPDQQPTFMESVESTLDAPIFVTKFSSDPTASQISFGANDFNYESPLQKITVDQSGTYANSWSYVGVDYSVNGNSLGTFDVVFDTGGPMMSASEAIVRGYYAQVSGAVDANGDASSWNVPCGTALPDMNLNLGGATLTIPGVKFYNGNTATTGTCQTWLVKENSANRGVIGDPFFNQHVVVFNQDEQSISWGNQA